MSDGLRTIVYPTTDLPAATALFRALLGAEPHTDQPYYVGFSAPGGQEIGLDPNGHRSGMTGPVGYWHVSDLQATLKDLVAAGATAHGDVRDVGGGRLIATVTDADGNVVGLLQP